MWTEWKSSNHWFLNIQNVFNRIKNCIEILVLIAKIEARKNVWWIFFRGNKKSTHGLCEDQCHHLFWMMCFIFFFFSLFSSYSTVFFIIFNWRYLVFHYVISHNDTLCIGIGVKIWHCISHKQRSIVYYRIKLFIFFLALNHIALDDVNTNNNRSEMKSSGRVLMSCI